VGRARARSLAPTVHSVRVDPPATRLLNASCARERSERRGMVIQGGGRVAGRRGGGMVGNGSFRCCGSLSVLRHCVHRMSQERFQTLAHS
jgi:hypothetical protein